MTQMLIDGITNITIHGGVLRVDCVTVGPDGKQQSAGTLLIPGPFVTAVLQTLVKGTQELDKKLREQTQQAGQEPANPTPSAGEQDGGKERDRGKSR